MRVLLNASALSGVIIFTVANIMGMNLGTAPDRLSGAASFNDSPLTAYPLFLTVCLRLGYLCPTATFYPSQHSKQLSVCNVLLCSQMCVCLMQPHWALVDLCMQTLSDRCRRYTAAAGHFPDLRAVSHGIPALPPVPSRGQAWAI